MEGAVAVEPSEVDLRFDLRSAFGRLRLGDALTRGSRDYRRGGKVRGAVEPAAQVNLVLLVVLLGSEALDVDLPDTVTFKQAPDFIDRPYTHIPDDARAMGSTPASGGNARIVLCSPVT